MPFIFVLNIEVLGFTVLKNIHTKWFGTLVSFSSGTWVNIFCTHMVDTTCIAFENGISCSYMHMADNVWQMFMWMVSPDVVDVP